MPVDADAVQEPLAELAPAVTDMDALYEATDVRPRESATEYTTDKADESTNNVDVLIIARTLAGAFECTAKEPLEAIDIPPAVLDPVANSAKESSVPIGW